MGTFSWLLLREVDKDGNRIIYDYKHIEEQSRSLLTEPQREPVLISVKWGGNDISGQADVFSVRIALADTATTSSNTTDLLNGNVLLAPTLVRQIAVCGPVQGFQQAGGGVAVGAVATTGLCIGSVAFHQYDLTYQVSADTGRQLLKAVTEKHDGVVQAKMRSFEYQGNGGTLRFGGIEPLIKDADEDKKLLLTRWSRSGVTAEPGAMTKDAAAAPMTTSVAARLMDINHDGRKDVAYLPGGIASPVGPLVDKADVKVTIPSSANNGTVSQFSMFGPKLPRSGVRTANGSAVVLDHRQQTIDGTHAVSVLVDQNGLLGFRSSPFSYSDFADLDGDGVEEGIFFKAGTADGLKFSVPWFPPDGSCFSEAFWSVCGAIDPAHPDFFDVCEFTSACEQMNSIDFDLCAAGTCWIEVDRFGIIYDDVADWNATYPLSAAGIALLEGKGFQVDSAALLIGVDSADLRARLGILDADKMPQLNMGSWNASNTMEKCAALVQQCQGTKFDGVPNARMGNCTPSTTDVCTASLLPPEMLLGVHRAEEIPESTVPLVPLVGWPAGIGKVTQFIPTAWGSFGAVPPYHSTVVSDFTAPIVDINADGLADVVLLRGMQRTIRSGLRPDFRFVPRAYLGTVDDNEPYGQRFRLDWDDFLEKFPALRDRNDAVSDFTASLNDVLVKAGAEACLEGDCPLPSVQRFAVNASYNAFLLDLNADSLPDLVSAKPDKHRDVGNNLEARSSILLDDAHEVFLNRGYRFGTPQGPGKFPLQTSSFSNAGPFKTLLKTELGRLVTEAGLSIPPRGTHLPMGASAMTDIDADGRTDVVFWYQVKPLGGAPLMPQREVWLNRGDRFERKDSLLDAFNGSNYRIADVEESTRLPDNTLAKIRSMLAADLLRLEDGNDDGLVDIVIPGWICAQPQLGVSFPDNCSELPLGNVAGLQWKQHNSRPIKYIPAQIIKNIGKHPDLLSAFSTNAGDHTSISYANARTDSNVVGAADYVPPGLQVVSAVTTQLSRGAEESVAFLSYGEWVRANAHGLSLGFASVTVRFVDSFEGEPTAGVEPRRQPTAIRTYHVSPEGDYALRGMVASDIFVADGVRSVSVPTYVVRAPVAGSAWRRIDRDVVESTECQLDVTWNDCFGTGFKTREEVTRRDGHGGVQASRTGDYTSGTWVDDVVSQRSLEDQRGPWILGLVRSETVTGRKSNLAGVESQGTLSNFSATYGARGRLLTRTETLVNSECAADTDGLTVSSFRVTSYNANGSVTGAVNNDVTVALGYDPNQLNVANTLVNVSKFVDGVKQPGLTTLKALRFVDLRSGEVWSSIDPNGAIQVTQRDGLGRPTAVYDALGKKTQSFRYVDTEPRSTEETHWTSATGGAVSRTTVDAGGNVLDRITWTNTAGVLTAPTRAELHDLDSAGLARRSYLPALTSSTSRLGAGPFISRDFDGSGRVTLQVSPDATDGRMTSTAYLPRAVVQADARDVVTETLTDWRGKALTTTREAGGLSATTAYGRDGLGRLSRLTNADGDIQNFEYDVGGRLVRSTLPHRPTAPASGVFEQCADRNGVVRRTTDPELRVVKSKVDELGRVVLKTVGGGGTTSQTHTFNYDDAARVGLGRLWQSVSPVGRTTLTYDLRGLLVKADTALGAQIGGLNTISGSMSWGLQGELLQTTSRGQVGATTVGLGDIVYGRDARGRVTGVRDVQTNTMQLVGTPTYDAFERITQVPIDRIVAKWRFDPRSQDLLEANYGANKLLRVVLSNYAKDGSPGLEERDGTIDSAGSGLTMSKSWVYDPLGRLQSQSIKRNGLALLSESYGWSPNGRLLNAGSQKYKYADGRLPGAPTSLGTRGLTWGAAGNVSKDTQGAVTRSASFDGNGCLTSLTAGTSKLSQLCGPQGEALFRSTTTPAGTRRVLTLGMAELRPDEGLLVQRLPVNGSVMVELAYNLTGTRSNSGSRIVMTDGRGSVLATAPLLSTTEPRTSEAQDFDAWGQPLKTGALKAPTHGYVGFEPDPAFGTYAFGRRVYDPTLRHWLSSDPLIGRNPEVDGSTQQLNFWGYAAGNPVLNTDTNGQCVPGLMGDACSQTLELAHQLGVLPPVIDSYVQMAHSVVGIPGMALEQTVPGVATASGYFGAAIQRAAQTLVSAAGVEDPSIRSGAEKVVAGVLGNAVAAATMVIGAKLGGEVGPNTQKRIDSTRARLEEHQVKLEAYKENPMSQDSKGFLARNSDKPDVVRRIVAGRIKHLEGEIANFKKQIANWESEGGQ